MSPCVSGMPERRTALSADLASDNRRELHAAFEDEQRKRARPLLGPLRRLRDGARHVLRSRRHTPEVKGYEYPVLTAEQRQQREAQRWGGVGPDFFETAIQVHDFAAGRGFDTSEIHDLVQNLPGKTVDQAAAELNTITNRLLQRATVKELGPHRGRMRPAPTVRLPGRARESRPSAPRRHGSRRVTSARGPDDDPGELPPDPPRGRRVGARHVSLAVAALRKGWGR